MRAYGTCRVVALVASFPVAQMVMSDLMTLLGVEGRLFRSTLHDHGLTSESEKYLWLWFRLPVSVDKFNQPDFTLAAFKESLQSNEGKGRWLAVVVDSVFPALRRCNIMGSVQIKTPVGGVWSGFIEQTPLMQTRQSFLFVPSLCILDAVCRFLHMDVPRCLVSPERLRCSAAGFLKISDVNMVYEVLRIC
jgi:hypothetical protein